MLEANVKALKILFVLIFYGQSIIDDHHFNDVEFWLLVFTINYSEMRKKEEIYSRQKYYEIWNDFIHHHWKIYTYDLAVQFQDLSKEEAGAVEVVQGWWLTPPPPDLHWSRPRYKYSLHTKDGSYIFLMKASALWRITLTLFSWVTEHEVQ